jgi:hypothetical protein
MRAIGTVMPIRAAMEEHGYSEAVQDEGWGLLQKTCTYSRGRTPELINQEVRGAIVAIDQKDEDIFHLVGASLTRHHPAQAAFVLDGIGPQVGSSSVLNMAILLDRLDALEAGPEREATRAEDHAALATLSSRRMNKQRREELRALVVLAKSAPSAPDPDKPVRERTEKERQASLIELRAWYEEWSAIARVCVKRRGYLQMLGLATRRRRSAEKAGEAKPVTDGTPGGGDEK